MMPLVCVLGAFGHHLFSLYEKERQNVSVIFWNNRLNNSCQNVHFWMNFPFKFGLFRKLCYNYMHFQDNVDSCSSIANATLVTFF